MNRPSPRRRRHGFTLVELLIVIVIIGILVALLVPAIAGAVRNANNARVTSEINSLATALEQFKTTYGDYPPSRIVLREGGLTATDLASTTMITAVPSGNFYGSGPVSTGADPDLTLGALAERSVRFMRKFFPKTAPANIGGSPPTWYDYNGNGRYDTGLIYLEGHECLTFFLGGIPNNDGQTIGLSGFGRDPRYPFTTQQLVDPSGNAIGAMHSDARSAPLYEFRGDRLIDDDGDGIPGYVDTLNSGTSARFYAYFSAYGKNVYDPNDVNHGDPSIMRPFRVNPGIASVNYPSSSISADKSPTYTVSMEPNPYTSNRAYASGTFASFLNPTSFQIISAGSDGSYGPGGQFVSNATSDRLPIEDSYVNVDARNLEKDNLTNFNGARLD